MADAKEIKDRLLNDVEGVCRHLLPGGKVVGHEYRTGDLQGSDGKSLAVELRGGKAGVWKDFASGETGDIFELWKKAANLSFPDVLSDARRFLGITDIQRPKAREKPPKPPANDLKAMTGSPAMEYLQEERGISPETAKLYRVRAHARHSEWNTDFLAFWFEDSDGEPVMLKSTGIKKKPDGSKDIWTTKPYYTLWGWWLVGPDDRCIIITEGEIDAMTVSQLDPGFPVLSMPSGASNLTWIENDFHALQRFEKIYLLLDADKAGNAAAAEIAKRLGRARVYRIPLPGLYKDANEVLTKGEPEDLEFYDWLQNAHSFDPPTLQGAASYRADAHSRMSRNRLEKEERTFLFPSLPFQYRDGETTLITGYPGHGKSEFLYQSHLHEMANGKAVCIASMEITPGEMLGNLAQQITGHLPSDEELDKAIDWLDGKLWFYAPAKEDLKWPNMLEDFRYCAQRFGVKRFVVDSLHFLVSKENYEGQDAFCDALCRFDQVTNVHTAFVAHALIKKGEEHLPRINGVEGSGGIVKPIDNGLSIWRNVAKAEAQEKEGAPEDNDTHDGLLLCWKQRLTGKRFSQKLWFDPDSRKFRIRKEDAAPDVNTEAQENMPF